MATYVVDQFKQNRCTIYHCFEDHALGKNANNIFLIFEGRSWTYKEFYDEVQLVGNWLMNDLGVGKGEMVALSGPNTPQYVMFLLALSGIGAACAYINSNLTANPLIHSVKLAGARYLLADRFVHNLVQPCEEALEKENIKTVYYDGDLTSTLHDKTPLPKALRENLDPNSTARLIYTSGTTGLPKGVMQVRAKEVSAAKMVSEYLGLKPGVRMYTCLPLYHTSGMNLCTLPTIYAGSTVVLSRKFSHKTFWPEVRSTKAEIVQYVGELARYLLNTPPSPMDKQHNVRMIWGNGIRPDVWEAFRQRFGVDTINEIYGATDGFATCMNRNRGGFGRNAIAVRGPLWHFLNGSRERRIKIDVDSEEILRDPKTGSAIPCKTGEAGETIHKVDPAMATKAFEKYINNPEAGLKRRLQNVFEKGDTWFRTGDLMRDDSDGCLYFVDRLGDTFRWRSENVSTNEVADVMGEFEQVAEANVYGVSVPHADGRAGCAAIVSTGPELDVHGLAQHALGNLPRYAVPLFLRIVKSMDYTATNKMQKGRLKADGIDWEKVSASSPEDMLFWLPPNSDCYVPYGRKEWESILSGAVKL
jgi:acyl-CoA synthetase (AMP-forming)/AMP-acid ligase II